MNKEQKIQELTERIENYQAEIDELKEELKKLQKKPYEISYPEDGTEMYYIDDYTGELEGKTFDIFDDYDKRLYEIDLLFYTEEEAEQFIKEQTLIKKIKCWAKEQQGDWKFDLDEYITKYDIYYSGTEKKLKIFVARTITELKKLPYFKSQEIAQACIDEFGDEIVEVFC
jgi:chromosome segregation ATPase